MGIYEAILDTPEEASEKRGPIIIWDLDKEDSEDYCN